MAEGPIQIPVHHVSSFDFDDAFSDTDDASFHTFSSTALREDMARHIPPTDSRKHAEPYPSFEVPFEKKNDSVSTFDVGGRTTYSEESEYSLPRAVHRRSATPPLSTKEEEEYVLSPRFDQIPLSTSDRDIGTPEEPPNPDTHGPPSNEEHPYPNVIIDTSQLPSNRVHIISEHPGEQDSVRHSDPPPAATSVGEQSSPNLTIPVSPDEQNSYSPHSATYLSTSKSLPDQSESNLKRASVHRPTRSVGPSALEKVMSKTRPTFLPPKPRDEDNKHMADWHHMMKLSRAAAEKRRQALQERRLEREKAVEKSLHIWENEIVPDWRVVNKNPALRKLWWRGIPAKLRASMWEHAVGNALALSKDHYRTCLSRAKRALASGIFPQTALDMIEKDISTTLPSIHIFHPETGPLYTDLKDMLYAWVVSRSDEGMGYTLGAAKIAAMILINMPGQQGFNVMRNLLERHCMRSFFGGERTKDDVEAYFRIFDTLLADGMPKIYFNFKQHQIPPAAYLPDWIIPLFINHLPFEACARVWDVILLEGDSFLYRAALGILAVLEPRLFFPDKKELLELLEGNNKPALDVARREGIILDGGKYEIYGVDEESLWERIDSMDDWWKESTWARLILRELPDI